MSTFACATTGRSTAGSECRVSRTRACRTRRWVRLPMSATLLLAYSTASFDSRPCVTTSTSRMSGTSVPCLTTLFLRDDTHGHQGPKVIERRAFDPSPTPLVQRLIIARLSPVCVRPEPRLCSPSPAVCSQHLRSRGCRQQRAGTLGNGRRVVVRADRARPGTG